jgi:sugar phosphate isomerase/epimerase
MNDSPWPIGVFTSIDSGLGVHWQVLGELKIPTIHLHAPARHTRTDENARRFRMQLDQMGVRLTCVFGGFDGESYADIPTVARTVGLVPAATRGRRLAEMREIADFSLKLDCPVVALHLGFVPHERRSDEYRAVVDVTRQLAEYCAARELDLHLETGQETVDALLQFIDVVDAPNLFVNFDPANMILYGTGEPIEALSKIGQRVHSVHCKDATWAERPGEEWGCEVPLGEGDVGIERFLQTLNSIGYRGPLTIEREIAKEPQRQKAEIASAVELLQSLRQQVLCPSGK